MDLARARTHTHHTHTHAPTPTIDFEWLHDRLRRVYHGIILPSLPLKRWINNVDSDFVRERMDALMRYVCPSVCHAVCVSVRVSRSMCVRPCVTRYVCPSVCHAVCVSVCLSYGKCVRPSVRLSLHTRPSIQPYTRTHARTSTHVHTRTHAHTHANQVHATACTPSPPAS